MANLPKKINTFKFSKRLKFLLDVLDQIIMDDGDTVVKNFNSLEYLDIYLKKWRKQVFHKKTTLLKYDVIIAKAQMNAKKGKDSDN